MPPKWTNWPSLPSCKPLRWAPFEHYQDFLRSSWFELPFFPESMDWMNKYFTCTTVWFLFEILLPKKFSYSCFHGAPLLPAFIWRFLPEYTFNQQKIHFLAGVSSARHIQSLDVDEELLLSVSLAFSKFNLPRFLAAFFRLFASCLSYLAIFLLMRNWNLQFLSHALTTLHVYSSKHVCFVALYYIVCYFGRVVRVECAQCI